MRLIIFLAVLLCCSSSIAKTPHNGNSVIEYYAGRMNVSDSLLRIAELYDAVDEWIGTPYRYGRSDKKGTDCSGFVRNVFRNFWNEELPRSASGLSKVIDPKPISELSEGDLVFFNYRGRTNSHVGIYLQNGWFVHASTVAGVTLANLYSGYYTRRFSKGGSLKVGSLEHIVLARMAERYKELPQLNPLTPLDGCMVTPVMTK